jgi:hypothetical protein
MPLKMLRLGSGVFRHCLNQQTCDTMSGGITMYTAVRCAYGKSTIQAYPDKRQGVTAVSSLIVVFGAYYMVAGVPAFGSRHGRDVH